MPTYVMDSRAYRDRILLPTSKDIENLVFENNTQAFWMRCLRCDEIMIRCDNRPNDNPDIGILWKEHNCVP